MASRERSEEDAELLVEAIAELGVALYTTFVMPFAGLSSEKSDEARKAISNRWFRFGRKLVDFMEVGSA